MKKRVVFALIATLFLSIFAVTFASAQTKTTDTQKIDSAYIWLTSQVDGKWASVDAETAALGLLALGYDDRLAADAKAGIRANQNAEQHCWPKANCKSLDTALSMLALQSLGEPVDDEAEYLIDRQIPFKVGGITWLLQVDTKTASSCTIKYDSNEYTLTIKKDRTYAFSSQVPGCLTPVDGNYWLRVSNNCLDKTYSITCEEPASISLPYRLDQTLYVSSETLISPADIAIKTVCIREGATCSYEATMWTAYALFKAGKEYTHLLPYLIGEAENNAKFLPDALLFAMTSKEEHANKLISQQNREGFWTDLGGRGRYWDTGIGILSIREYAPENATKGQAWLLKNQNSDGSFGTTNKIKDTAIVLYGSWPKAVAQGLNDCSDVYGFFCRSSCLADEQQTSASCSTGICCKPEGLNAACSALADCSKPECSGQFVTDIFSKRGKCELNKETICNDNFDNDNDGFVDLQDTDCSVTCFDIGGQECSSTDQCDVTTRKTLDADACCTGTCAPAQVSCQAQSGEFCSSNQQCDGNQVAANDASASNVCCVGSCKSKTNLWPWIILLAVLLLGAGIYFAYKKGYLDKYKKYFNFKFGRAKPSAEGKTPSPFRPQVRPYSPAQPSPTPFSYQTSGRHYPERKSDTKTDSELKETMERLKRYSEKK